MSPKFRVREISKIRNDKKKVSQLFSNLFLISLISNLIIITVYVIYSLLVSKEISLFIYLLIGLQIV